MSESIKKIISLINKTGDNCVVLDEAGNPAYVIDPRQYFTDLADGVITAIGNIQIRPLRHHGRPLFPHFRHRPWLPDRRNAGRELYGVRRAGPRDARHRD